MAIVPGGGAAANTEVALVFELVGVFVHKLQRIRHRVADF